MTEFPVAKPVVVHYSDISDLKKNLFESLESAFGLEGMGIIVVEGVPEFEELRAKLLPLSSVFATLPEEVKAKTEHEASCYSYGWSHGKERLKKGAFDTFKGSYYNNPQYDVPTTDESMIAAAPEVCSPNIWPKEDLPELEEAFKKLGQLIVDVGILLAKHCDLFVLSRFGSNYERGTFEKVIRESRTCKARLLHYYPIPEEGKRDVDSWCGWHNDHSALTGLCPAMFRDINIDEEISCPDPDAGLYIKSRTQDMVKVNLPRTCLAFQIGECAQVFTGGILRATPHAVRALRYPDSKHVARDSFAVFMQPNFDFELKPPTGVDAQHIAVGQYKEGMRFSDFGKATIARYYSTEG